MVRRPAQIDRLEREAADVLDGASRINEQLISARNEHAGYEEGMTRLRSELSAAETECSSLREQHSEGVKAVAEWKSRRDGLQNRLQTIGDLPFVALIARSPFSSFLTTSAGTIGSRLVYSPTSSKSISGTKPGREFPAAGTAVCGREGSRAGVCSGTFDR